MDACCVLASPCPWCPAEPPARSVTADPAFSRKPRCAQVEHAQQCRCEPGFHMSGTAAASLCQGKGLRVCGVRSKWPWVCSSACFPADVDECELYQAEGAPRLCAHACVNLPGSYRCACPSGYSLLADGKSCEGEAAWTAFPFCPTLHDCPKGSSW